MFAFEIQRRILPMNGYCCEPTSITMGVMAAGSMAGAAMSAKEQAVQAGLAEDQQRKQKIEMVKSMNIQNQDLDIKYKQELQDTIAAMSQNNLQGIKNKGLINAAIGESGLTGRSMDRIARQEDVNLSRANARLQENYERDYEKIYLQKESAKANTTAQINGMAPVNKPNSTVAAIGVGLSGIKGALGAYQGSQNGGGTLGAITGGLNTINTQENR